MLFIGLFVCFPLVVTNVFYVLSRPAFFFIPLSWPTSALNLLAEALSFSASTFPSSDYSSNRVLLLGKLLFKLFVLPTTKKPLLSGCWDSGPLRARARYNLRTTISILQTILFNKTFSIDNPLSCLNSYISLQVRLPLCFFPVSSFLIRSLSFSLNVFTRCLKS
jgi:hypothetical protein